MQHYFFRLIIACFFIASISACKKTETPPLVSNGFVQFKLNGAEYRYDDYDQKTGDIAFAIYPTTYIANYTSSVTNVANQSLYFQQESNKPLLQKKYTFTGTPAGERVYFNIAMLDLTNYIYTSQSSATVEITRLDTVPGGKVEGKFSMANLTYRDRNNVAITPNHRITDGFFSLTVK